MALPGDIVTQEVIEISVQPPMGNRRRRFALQGSAGGITRIGEKRFLPGFPLRVQSFEGGPGHKHLAPNLKLIGIAATLGQDKRNRTYGTYVLGNIVSLNAVTTCHSPH